MHEDVEDGNANVSDLHDIVSDLHNDNPMSKAENMHNNLIGYQLTRDRVRRTIRKPLKFLD